MPSSSIRMVRVWSDLDLVGVGDSPAASMRRMTVGDVETIGTLLWRAFGQGGVDGFDDAPAAESEARDTLAGKWGPMVWEASLLALVDDQPAAASIAVLDDAHGMSPLLAFLATDPVYQQRGLGGRLVGETLLRLDRCGIRELHLAVDPQNPARRLYERLGFVRA